MSEGRILCSGTAEEIVAHDEVKRKYLGEIELPGTRVDSRGQRVSTSGRLSVRVPKEASAKNLRSDDPVPDLASVRSPAARKSGIPTPDQDHDRPKIVFSKPRRSRKVVAPFKSTDLD